MSHMAMQEATKHLNLLSVNMYEMVYTNGVVMCGAGAVMTTAEFWEHDSCLLLKKGKTTQILNSKI